MLKKIATMFVLIGFTGFTMLTFAGGVESNLPISKQASLIESYSSSELTIKATGFGKKDKNALLDLQKAAVYFVLYLGTDPILRTQDAKNKFEMIAESFFDQSHIFNFISWQADKVISTVEARLPNGKKGIKITKMVRVNKKLIIDELAAKGIVSNVSDLATAIGLPTIMVVPEVKRGETPLKVFETNKFAVTAAAVIESYLTARKYDVVVPRAAEQINEQVMLQSQMKDVNDDISYMLALAMGSDVYISFAGTVEGSKASVSVKAYETTTARLLGTETGYSQNRPGVSQQALVEEAINDAVDKVLSRITAYWEDDLKKGSQYKLIFKLTGNFEGDLLEEITDEISDLMDEVFDLSKENIITDKTLDYRVWAKKADFKKSSKIYRYFRDNMVSLAKLKKININRKLIIIEVMDKM